MCVKHCFIQIMVGRAGPASAGPGSVVTGYANPVCLTTNKIGVFGGEFAKSLRRLPSWLQPLPHYIIISSGVSGPAKNGVIIS
ncbi:ash family protein [Salmonella enterica]|nr:ash family protein [Salmonella enterica]EHK5999292.1 ash family protein [Salmonella enterica]EIF5124630.1 ash family protein [Salmonella enterica]EIF5348687.1 ash family protein [Salmonella enterica]EIF5657284.1 ash family protein [Salmonella enterica]